MGIFVGLATFLPWCLYPWLNIVCVYTSQTYSVLLQDFSLKNLLSSLIALLIYCFFHRFILGEGWVGSGGHPPYCGAQ